MTSIFMDVIPKYLMNLTVLCGPRMPNGGYRLVKGELLARGCRVQWHKVSMHRMDGAGILARMLELGFVARRSYCVHVPLPLSTIN